MLQDFLYLHCQKDMRVAGTSLFSSKKVLFFIFILHGEMGWSERDAVLLIQKYFVNDPDVALNFPELRIRYRIRL